MVRLPLFEKATGQIDKDFAWLPRLAPYLPVEIPGIVAKGAPNDDYPFQWTIYGWLDGVTPPADAFLDDSASVSLAGFVRALHSVDLPHGPEARRGAPLVVQDTGARTAIAQMSDVYDAAALTQLWEETPRGASLGPRAGVGARRLAGDQDEFDMGLEVPA